MTEKHAVEINAHESSSDIEEIFDRRKHELRAVHSYMTDRKPNAQKGKVRRSTQNEASKRNGHFIRDPMNIQENIQSNIIPSTFGF